MKKITELAHELLLPYFHRYAISADFTMGNGYDTIFLAKHSHRVYAFDIQKEAFHHTKELAQEQGFHQIEFILDSHEHADQYIKEQLDIGIFNFGYLPHGDESLTTMLASTQIAVPLALSLLKPKGVLLLCVYPGHLEGKKESVWLDDYVKTLSNPYLKIETSCKQAPYLYLIEKCSR